MLSKPCGNHTRHQSFGFERSEQSKNTSKFLFVCEYNRPRSSDHQQTSHFASGRMCTVPASPGQRIRDAVGVPDHALSLVRHGSLSRTAVRTPAPSHARLLGWGLKRAGGLMRAPSRTSLPPRLPSFTTLRLPLSVSECGVTSNVKPSGTESKSH